MILCVKSLSVTIQMKATGSHFSVILFAMLYKVFLTFESVDKILKCGHSNESYSSNTVLWYCLLTMKTEVVLTIECG